MSTINCERRGPNIFVRVDGRKKESFRTQYQFEDIDGKHYNIYISSRKRAFIIKKTKTGKEYKVVLPKSVSDDILKEIEQVKPNMIVDN